MRVLSVQQPWAQLIVRGLQTVDVRSWEPKKGFRGRIAIHASNRVPSKEIEAEWHRDEQTAKVFADQGWRTRHDLRALPRQAILGTVELRDVVRGGELHREGAKTSPHADFHAALFAALGRRSARFDGMESFVTPIPVVIPDDQFAWTFGSPIAIRPIENVEGQQHLWTAPKDLASEIIERQSQVREGRWRAPEVDAGKRKRAMDDWARDWKQAYDDEAWKLIIEAHWELKCEWFPFEDEKLEASFRATMQKLKDEKGVVVPGLGLHLPVPPELRQWFGARSRVRALEYESTLRWEINEWLRQVAENADLRWKHRQIVALLKELKTKAARKPMSQAEIRTRVRAEFRRLMEEGVEGELDDLLPCAD